MNRTLLVLLLFASPSAFGGAWDVGPFDNDDALDFVYELADSKSYRMVWSAFGPCMRAKDSYLDSWDGSRAVAAAALVAANLSGDTSAVPEEIRDWISAKSWAADVKLVGTAEVCMKTVTNAETSELAELWADSGLFDDWKATITAIEESLQQ